jgi:hypothetical protein
MSFPTKEELLQMNVAKLRLVDVHNKEEENLLQAVISLKDAQNPPKMEIKTIDVPDITSKEEELKWQKILDDRRAGLKPQVEVKSDASGIEIKVEQAEVKPVEGFKCETCGKISKTDKLLKMHKGRFHKNKEYKLKAETGYIKSELQNIIK